MPNRKSPTQLYRERTLNDLTFRLFRVAVRLEGLQCNPENFIKSFLWNYKKGLNCDTALPHERHLRDLIKDSHKVSPSQTENEGFL